MRKLRISLRHTGIANLQFGVSRGYYSNMHWNIYFGRFFLAIREKRPNEVPRKFIELDMGRRQLKHKRLLCTMTEYEQHAYYAQHPPMYLEPWLKNFRAIEENQKHDNA